MSNEDLLFKIGADGSSAEASLMSIANSAKSAAASFIGFGTAAEAIKFVIEKSIEMEKETIGLANAVKSLKTGTEEAYNSINKFGEELVKTSGFMDGDIKKALTNLVYITGSVDVAQKSMQATMDLSRARHLDLEVAARLVGRAYAGNSTMLRKMGVEMDEHIKGMDAVNKVYQVFGGSNDSYLQTTAGRIDLVRAKFESLSEEIGTKALPSINNLMNDLSSAMTFWETAGSNSNGFFSTLWNGFTGLTSFIMEVVIPTLIEAVEFIINVPARFSALLSGKLFNDWKTNFADIAVNLGKNWWENWINGANSASAKNPFQMAQGLGQSGENSKATSGEFENESFKEYQEELAAFNIQVKGLTDLQIKTIYDMYATEGIMAAQNTVSLIEMEKEKQKKLLELKKEYGSAAGLIYETTYSKEAVAFKKGVGALMPLMNSKNQQMFEIGKAASIANILTTTPKTAMDAMGALSGIPVVGPALGIAAAAAAIAYGAEQMASVAATRFNPAGAATGLFNNTNESMISTFQPQEIVIPQRFSEMISSGKMALTGTDTVNNNAGSVNLNIEINSNGLDKASEIVKNDIIPALKTYFINERGGIMGRITGSGVVLNV